METLIDKLKKMKEEYKMYSDSEHGRAQESELKLKHLKYTRSEYIDELLWFKRCQTKAAAYWSFYNHLQIILEEHDKPLDFVI